MTSDDIQKLAKLIDEKLAKREDRILAKMDESLAKSESRVMGEIGKFLSDQLIPLIEEKADKSDIDRLETKLDRVIDTSLDHERRIKTIEHIPSIAHQIRK